MNDSPQAATAEAPLPDLTGIEECFHPVVTQYGRPLFAFVLNSQLAQQAASVLMEQAQKHHSHAAIKAVQIIAGSLNDLSQSYATLAGWTPELFAQCSRDIERAYAAKIVVPPAIIVPGSH